MRVRPKPVSLFLVLLGSEIHNRRELLPAHELAQHVDTVAVLTVPAPEQYQVIASPRELGRQVAGRGRVVGGDNRVGPVSGDVMHEQRPEIGLLIDDHDLDAHG